MAIDGRKALSIHALKKLHLSRIYLQNLDSRHAVGSTGKTLCAATVAERYDAVIILSPLKVVAEQNRDRFSHVLEHAMQLVDSDGTRDVDLMVEFATTHEKYVISATFKSVDVVWEMLERLGTTDQVLVIVDEFHDISRHDLVDEEQPMNKLLSSDAKMLFCSATPRIYECENTDDESQFDKFFGPTAYRLPLLEAIQRKLVTDYKVYFPMLHEEGQEDQVRQEVSALKDVDATVLSKAFFLLKGMLYDGARKCIVYLATHENVHAFHDVVTKLAVDYFGLGFNFWCSAILSSDSARVRKERLAKFSNYDGFGVLLNCTILSQAVDIVACDSIFMADPCLSKVRIVQRVCRANRLDPANPCKESKIFVWADEESDELHFIAALKEVDATFSTKLRVTSRRYECLTESKKLELIEATNTILRFCISVMEYKRGENQMKFATKTITWVKEHKRLPTQQEPILADRRLGIWINNYRRAVEGKNGLNDYTSVSALLDKEIHGWRDPYFWNAMAIAKDCAKWVKDNERLPSSNGDVVEKKLGFWICCQRGADTDKARMQLYPEVIEYLDKNITHWKDPFLYRSMQSAVIFAKWVRENGKFPAYAAARTDEEKKMRNWRAGMRQRESTGHKCAFPEVIRYLNREAPGWNT